MQAFHPEAGFPKACHKKGMRADTERLQGIGWQFFFDTGTLT